jgi:hypothetical protein
MKTRLALTLACLTTTLTTAGSAAAASPTLHYGGGQVLTGQINAAILYVSKQSSDYWRTPAGVTNQSVFETWVTNIGDTKWFNVIAQYYDKTGNHPSLARFPILARSWYNEPNLPNGQPAPYSASDVHTYALSWIKSNTSTPIAPAPLVVFYVFEPGTGTTCGDPNATGCNGVLTTYGLEDGYVNAVVSGDTTQSNVWFHELAEVITDANATGWYASGTDLNGNPESHWQIGDVCDYSFEAPTPLIHQSHAIDPIRIDNYHTYQVGPVANPALGGAEQPVVCAKGYTSDVDGYFKSGASIDYTSDTTVLPYVPIYPPGFGLNSEATANGVEDWDPGSASHPHGNWGSWYVDANNHMQQTYPTDYWSHAQGQPFIPTNDWGAAPLGYAFAGSTDVASMGDGRVDVFVVGYSTSATPTAPHLFHRYWDLRTVGLAPSWIDMGDLKTSQPGLTFIPGLESIVSGPGAVSRYDGDIQVYLTANVAGDSHPHLVNVQCAGTQCDAGAWSSWDLGAPSDGSILAGDPDAASWGNGRLDVFVREAGGAKLAHWFYTGDSTNWNYAPFTWHTEYWAAPASMGIFTGNPSVTGMGEDRLFVTAADASSRVWTYQWNQNIPSAWMGPGATISGGLDITSWQ